MAKRGASPSPTGAALSGRLRGGTPRAQTLKQVEESASLVKPVKRSAPPGASNNSSSNAVVLGLGGAVIVLLLVLVWVFSNQAPLASVAPAAVASQDWSEFIAEQLRQSEARLRTLIEAKASHSEVAAAIARHSQVTEQLKSALTVRAEQTAKEIEAMREAMSSKIEQEKQVMLTLLREEIRKAAERPVPVAPSHAGEAAAAAAAAAAAGLEQKWQQLEESLQRRVADVEHAVQGGSDTHRREEKKDYAWEVVAASPTYKDFDAFSKYAIKVLGVTVRQQLPGPETVLATPFVDNKCWSFAGSSGTLTLRLRERIVVGSVSLQQTSAALSFFTANAPREFDVLDEREELLGSYAYDGAKAQAEQVFVVPPAAETETVTFRFRSNHGAADFTCVGKIRVHKHGSKEYRN